MGPRIAWISGGNLFVGDGEGEPRPILSAFGESVRERATSLKRRHSWKHEGRSAGFLSGGFLWGPPAQDPQAMRIAITGLCRGRRPAEVLYTLEADRVSGICALDIGTGSETRLQHGDERRPAALAVHPDQELVACVFARNDGTSHVGVLRPDGADLGELTEGDSVEGSPSWVPGEREMVFQSAGIGRNPRGLPVTRTAFSIQRLHLDRGDLHTLVADDARDHVSPRIGPGGDLHFIRRPFRQPGGGSPMRAVLDTALFLPRILLAVFHWLNSFTTRHSGRSLITAAGQRRGAADLQRMLLLGDAMEAGDDSAAEVDEGVPRGLVPASWQLVRRTTAGAETTLARGVLAYDLGADGAIAYTTGTGIFHLGPDGRRTCVVTASGIEQVVLLS